MVTKIWKSLYEAMEHARFSAGRYQETILRTSKKPAFLRYFIVANCFSLFINANYPLHKIFSWLSPATFPFLDDSSLSMVWDNSLLKFLSLWKVNDFQKYRLKFNFIRRSTFESFRYIILKINKVLLWVVLTEKWPWASAVKMSGKQFSLGAASS